jgi:nucleotide-binding universal stress UspA family protein
MKILAPFDGSTFSETTLAELAMMAALPTAEFTFFGVAHEPHGRRQRPPARQSEVIPEAGGVLVDLPEPKFLENKDQAVERRRAQLNDYLHRLAAKLPGGANVRIETEVSDDAAEAIVNCARRNAIDVIVMATHSRGPLAQALLGSTTTSVVRSGVAPVLLVHPKGGAKG